LSTILETRELKKSYRLGNEFVPVLHGIDFKLDKGQYGAIMGPSGSGKSTFMNILGCLDRATSGRFLLAGNDVATLDKDALARLRGGTIGFVFQGFNLLPRMTLQDNVALPLVYASVDKETRRERARAMLDKVGLGRYAESLPNRISGGQQQRVAIARALVNEPRLILADEPTGNLDSQNSHQILEYFTKITEEARTAMVVVTHDNMTAEHCTRKCVLTDGYLNG